MRTIVKTMLFAATTLTGALASPALAQNATEDDDGAIIVTARRVEERLQDVPISMTVLSQSQLDNRNITTASDLATYTPSLTSNSRFGPDKSSFTIRGFNQESNTSPTVGVYFADVVAPRAAAGTASGNGAGPGSLFDLQNIQVLKGPQGTLFGRNTTGGAILLVPKKPTDNLEGYVEGSIGNYDMRRVQAVLNLPLADTFRVRLGVDRQKRDGYLHNRSGVGPKDFGDSNYLAARLSIVGDLTPTLENYLVANYSKSDTNGTLLHLIGCERDPTKRSGRGVLVAPYACAQIDRQNARGDGFYDVENQHSNPYNTTEQWQLINTTTWLASDALTLKNIISYGQFRERVAYSIGGENFVIPTGANTGKTFSSTVLLNAPGQESAYQSTFTEELQLQGRTADGNFNWQVGGYLEISNPLGSGNTSYSQAFVNCTDVYAFQCFGPLTGVSGLSLVYNKVAFRNLGVYGQGTYHLTDKLAVTAGLRYTSDRTVGSGRRIQVTFPTPNVPRGTCANTVRFPGVVTLNPADCDSGEFAQKTSRPTWLIDLEYKPVEDVMLYAKYSRGYRQGSVNPSIIGLETWGPEKVDTYELGLKSSFTGAVRGYFNVTGFYNDFRDQQLSLVATGRIAGVPGTQVIVNAGKSRIYGVEVDASVTPFDGLKLDLGYAYLNTKLQEFVTPSLSNLGPYNPPASPTLGGDLPLSPHHRVTATATYRLPLDESIGRISFGGTFTYTARQETQINSPSPFRTLPSSKLVNLNFNWESVAGAPVDLALFVTNLTKEETYLNTGNSWNNGYEAVVANVPRMYGLRLKYRFGD